MDDPMTDYVDFRARVDDLGGTLPERFDHRPQYGDRSGNLHRAIARRAIRSADMYFGYARMVAPVHPCAPWRLRCALQEGLRRIDRRTSI